MSTYTEYFLNSPSSVAQLELLEISHPNFSKVYRIVRNSVAGCTVTHEDNASEHYEFYPLTIVNESIKQNLDWGINVQLGDVDDVLTIEMDNVSANDGYNTKPVVKYRVYRDDDLTTPLIGPFELEVTALAFTLEASLFSARPPNINLNSSGESYAFNRFPTLKGFI